MTDITDLPSLYSVTGDIKDINTLLISRADAVRLNARDAQAVPEGKVLVDRGALNIVIRALRRDAEEGRQVRGEMADLLSEAPAAPQPLTDEQATSLAKQLGWDTMPERFPLIVRAIEQAHGIGVKND